MLRVIKKLAGLLGSQTSFGPFHCPVCGKGNVGMDPLPMHYFQDLQEHGHIHSIFLQETLNIAHYACKNCFATDRERLMALFLDGQLKGNPAIDILDIAPSPSLVKFLKKYDRLRYRSTDLSMHHVSDRQDITEMKAYSNDQFDLFICSHVLEHVNDDKKAISELYRILKPGGKGIVMVPINLGLKQTMEDPSCTDNSLRWKYFGQDDHVRMYSKPDFLYRLTIAGFAVEELGEKDFGADVFKNAAISKTSILYIVHK